MNSDPGVAYGVAQRALSKVFGSIVARDIVEACMGDPVCDMEVMMLGIMYIGPERDLKVETRAVNALDYLRVKPGVESGTSDGLWLNHTDNLCEILVEKQRAARKKFELECDGVTVKKFEEGGFVDQPEIQLLLSTYAKKVAGGDAKAWWGPIECASNYVQKKAPLKSSTQSIYRELLGSDVRAVLTKIQYSQSANDAIEILLNTWPDPAAYICKLYTQLSSFSIEPKGVIEGVLFAERARIMAEHVALLIAHEPVRLLQWCSVATRPNGLTLGVPGGEQMSEHGTQLGQMLQSELIKIFDTWDESEVREFMETARKSARENGFIQRNETMSKHFDGFCGSLESTWEAQSLKRHLNTHRAEPTDSTIESARPSKFKGM